MQADPKIYEFCFIEKNRIDGFARVAAHTPQAQQLRLAALFGLEEFNAFSSQFNENFENYLDCVGKKTKELSEKEKQIAGHKQILLQIPVKQKEIATQQENLLSKYPTCKTLDELKIHISGSDDSIGLSKKLAAEIARLSALKTVTDPGIEAILAEAKYFIALIEERKVAKQFLAGFKDELSLKDLYLAILANQKIYENNCPACESVILKDGQLAVRVNPYSNATEKLRKFEAALKKEARIAEIKGLLDSRWPALRSKMEKLGPTAKLIAFVDSAKISSLSESCESVVDNKTLESTLNYLLEQSTLLNSLKASIANFNSEVAKSKDEIKNLEMQGALLVKHLEEIASIKASLKDIASSAAAANLAIKNFKDENEALIKLAEAEKPIITRNVKYLQAYNSFREKLLRYNRNLPLSLAADLNEKALKFYNAINKHDHISDQIENLTLPTSTGRRIEIEFEAGQRHDALQILSEGHIRCLGLSILLSKIVRDDLPFLIFDDVVNSIDDEHRAGIIELILGDIELNRRQIIITTHGEDFVKRLENFVAKADYKNVVNRIDFLMPSEAKKISVKLNSPRHYLIVADQRLKDGQIRDCLSYVRKSFEELLTRLWKRIATKNYSVQFEVAIRVPGGQPDLMSVATGLHKFLTKKEVVVYKDVLPLLEKMLGREKTHAIEWTYINKGTHEEGRAEEFDAALVKEMLALVDEMDAAIEKGPSGLAKAA